MLHPDERLTASSELHLLQKSSRQLTTVEQQLPTTAAENTIPETALMTNVHVVQRFRLRTDLLCVEWDVKLY